MQEFLDKAYEVQLEISGPAAMWARPDCGDTAVSYPAPTFGAVKAIFESVLLSDWVEIVPTRCEICSPVIFHTYNTNYGGPLRKSGQCKGENSFQLIAEILINVCYRLYAKLEPIKENYHLMGPNEQKRQISGTTNGPHAYKEVFYRKLNKGRLSYTPFLGWKEFTPNYVGEFRPNTKICEEVNDDIPSMLVTSFYLSELQRNKRKRDRRECWNPVFKPASIRKGVLEYV